MVQPPTVALATGRTVEMQVKIRRSSPKRSRKKQALIAAGAIGLAAEGARRRRNRKYQADAEEH